MKCRLFNLLVSYWYRCLQFTVVIYTGVLLHLLTWDGSLFNPELVYQGELTDRCIFSTHLYESTYRVHDNYIGC